VDIREVKATVRKDRQAWLALVAALDANPEAVLHAPGSPPWTARDVYAHLARWMSRSVDELEAHLKGDRLPPVPGTDDEINARWATEDAGLSLEEARGRAHAACERRLRSIQAVPSDRWDPRGWALANADGWKHFEAHRRAIIVPHR
jgi:hypothetical protein